MRRCAPALLCLAAATGCLADGTTRHTLEHDGRRRVYFVHVPPALADDATPRPLVVALHGAGGTGRQMERFSGLSPVADAEQFLVVYPSGIRRTWNDGRDADLGTERGARDDAGFLLAMLDRVQAEYPVDPARVYVTGISNGGFMTYRLANDHAERFAAIAPVATGLTLEIANDFHPSRPLPVYVISGTQDPLVPYNGGDIGFEGGRKAHGKILDTWRTAQRWAQHNGCTGEPAESDLDDTDPNDGCRVTRTRWTGGAAPVVLDTIHGGGHTWPGGRQYLPKRTIGPVCRDYDAARAIWEFFRDHRRAVPNR